MSILNTSHLKKYYGKDESLVKALDDVSVSVEEGQFAAIIGTSGSGKSTLLNLLGGLDSPTSGSVQVEDKQIEKLTEEQLTVFRRKIENRYIRSFLYYVPYTCLTAMTFPAILYATESVVSALAGVAAAAIFAFRDKSLVAVAAAACLAVFATEQILSFLV